MSAADNITVTVGWIARHTPKGAGAGGREAAILDIAQDLLLRELHEVGSREFDLDDIGALAVPVPTEAELAKTVSTRYAFLADLDTEERQLAGRASRIATSPYACWPSYPARASRRSVSTERSESRPVRPCS